MSDGPEWFAPKRYGYGSGLPISWQGWAVLAAFIAVVLVLSLTIGHRPIQKIAALIPVCVVFTVICARTTKGGWRWRSGDED